MDIKSVNRDNLLRNYVVIMSNLLKHADYLNTVLKSLKSPMLLDNKLPRSDERHVNSWTDDELVSRTLFYSYCSFDRSEKFRTFIYFNFGVWRTETLFQKRNTEHQ